MAHAIFPSMWGAVQPKDSPKSRLRLDFGLRSAILAFNEWAVPGLGGVFFVRQLSWSCMALTLASDGRLAPARIAESLEALASWIVVRRARGRTSDDRVQGKRKFPDRGSLSVNDIVKDGAYVTVPFRRSATRALPGLGFCQSDEFRFNDLLLSQPGRELAESAFGSHQAREAISRWLSAPDKPYRSVPDVVKGALAPGRATDAEKHLVSGQLRVDERRATVIRLLKPGTADELNQPSKRNAFIESLRSSLPEYAAQLETCFLFEDVRMRALEAAQAIVDEAPHGYFSAASLGRVPLIRKRFESLVDACDRLQAPAAPDAPKEAIIFANEQGSGRPLTERLCALAARAPIVFTVLGGRVALTGHTRELLADEPFDSSEGGLPPDNLPIPRPLRRLDRLLSDLGRTT